MQKTPSQQRVDSEFTSHETFCLYIFLGIILFSIAYFPYIINDRYLTDDGVWFGQNGIGREAAKQQLFELGRPFLWHMVAVMDWFQGFVGPHLQVVRLYGFACYLTAYLISMRSLYLLGLFSARDCFFIASLSALAPLNFSRISIATTLNYGTAYLLFVLGVFAAVKQFAGRGSPWVIFLSGIFLFLSYFVESFICLGAILWLPFYLGSRLPRTTPFSWRREIGLLRTFAMRNPHLWAPIIASLLFAKAPTGAYSGVNSITVDKILRLFVVLPYAVVKNFVSLFNVDIFCTYSLNTIVYVGYAVGALFLFFSISKSRSRPKLQTNPSITDLNPIFSLLFSFVILCVAVFPYVLVGKSPMPRQFEDRHQLTLSLVIGPVLFISIASLCKEKVRPWVLAGLVAIFTAMTSVGYQSFLYEAHVRDAIVEKLRENDDVRSSKSVLFNIDVIYDPTGSRLPRLFDNRMQIHEYNELLFKAYGDMTRAGFAYNWEGVSRLREIVAHINDYCSQRPNYLCAGAPYDSPQYVVAVRQGPVPFLTNNSVRDQITKLFYPARYEQQLKQAIRLTLIPLPPLSP